MLKKTSYAYGKEHQLNMLSYYRKSKIKSDQNTEYQRVVLADKLIKKYVLPGFKGRIFKNITFVDIGCSVGLFAIEYAKKGFNSFGIDFDPEALKIANRLKKEEKVNPKFLQMDVSDWNLDRPIDIALCFDIFEHLHDDELGSMLVGIRKKLSEKGCLVFHTLPMQYDYLFWDDRDGKIKIPFLLKLFKHASVLMFSRIVNIYALLIDIGSLIKGGVTHQELIKKEGHCNPLTPKRLEDILKRAGYKLLYLNTGFLSDVQLDDKDKDIFYKQIVTHRSLYGVAVPEDFKE